MGTSLAMTGAAPNGCVVRCTTPPLPEGADNLPSDLTAILDRAAPPASGSTSVDVDDEVGGVLCRGYLFRPDDDETHPGMLVLHEWTGIGDYGRMRADMLTRFGDVALAADLYGADARPHAAGGTRGRGPVLQGLASAPEPTRRQLRDPARPAGRRSGSRRRIGYCFGGAAALQLAFTGIDVGGVVSFHGPADRAGG